MSKCQVCNGGEVGERECEECGKKVCKECFDRESGKCIMCRQGTMVI